jgi:hypothetical protein
VRVVRRVKAGEDAPRCVEVVGEPAARLVVTVRGDGEPDGAAVVVVGASHHKLVSHEASTSGEAVS